MIRLKGFISLTMIMVLADFAASQTQPKLTPYAEMRFGETAFRTGYPMECSAFSPDGKLLAVGCSAINTEGRFIGLGTLTGPEHVTIYVFDAVTGEIKECHDSRGPKVWGVAFSPDQRFLAWLNPDGEIVMQNRRLDKPDWKSKTVFAQTIRFLPKGDAILTHDPKTAYLLSMTDGRILKTYEQYQREIHTLEISDSGESFAIGSRESGEVHVIETRTGKKRHRFELTGRTINGLAFSPDEKRLIAQEFDGDSVAWDLTTGKELWRDKPKELLERRIPITFSRDGSEIICLGLDGRVLDAMTGKLKSRRSNHGIKLQSGSISPDRRFACLDYPDHRVRVIDLTTGKLTKPTEGYTAPALSLAFAEQGKAIYTVGQDGLFRWDLATRTHRVISDDQFNQVVASLDGEYLAVVNLKGEISIWDIRQKRMSKRSTINGHFQAPFFPILHATSVGLVADLKDEIQILDWKENRFLGRKLETHCWYGSKRSDGEPFAVSLDGRTCIQNLSSDDSPRTRWWDFVEGKVIREQNNGLTRKRLLVPGEIYQKVSPEESPITPLLFLPNGRFFIGGNELGYVLSDAKDGKVIRVLCDWKFLWAEQPLSNDVYVHRDVPFAVSPDGRLLAVRSKNFMILLIEIATGKIRRVFPDGDIVKAMTFSPDGRRLASIGLGPWVTVWDLYQPDPIGMNAENDPVWTAHLELCELLKRPTELLARVSKITVTKPEENAQLKEWIGQLDSPRYAVREQAQKNLLGLTYDELSLIDEKLKQSGMSVEARDRLSKIHAHLSKAPVSAQMLKQSRLLEVIEILNTPEGRREMARLATGDQQRPITQEAREGLERMMKRAPVSLERNK